MPLRYEKEQRCRDYIFDKEKLDFIALLHLDSAKMREDVFRWLEKRKDVLAEETARLFPLFRSRKFIGIHIDNDNTATAFAWEEASDE